jgi:coenzyme F420-reducing hydrogenase beta subunit
MIGFLSTGDKKECFGCGACFNACPKHAIIMQQDNEGFLYPTVNSEKCVSCNLCHNVCPQEKGQKYYEISKAFVGYNLEYNVRKESSSGGAFKSIIDAVQTDTVVFGVEWNGRSNAVHTQSPKCEAYERFRKSKYIQSDTGNTYQQVKELLKIGREIIYVGTPCQISGLKTYLGQDSKNLLCVDIVCHGVPSGKILENYFKSIDKKNDKVKRIDFRQKEKRNNVLDSKCALLTYESGKQRVADYDSSSFLRGFANGLFFRPSCAVCPFAQAKRTSDLTIGDAWGVEKAIPELNPHEGVSIILVNTDKGKSLVQQILTNHNSYYTEVSSELIISGNGRLNRPDVGHSKRDSFFEKYEEYDFEKLVQKYIPKISKIRKMASRIKRKMLYGE